MIRIIPELLDIWSVHCNMEHIFLGIRFLEIRGFPVSPTTKILFSAIILSLQQNYQLTVIVLLCKLYDKSNKMQRSSGKWKIYPLRALLSMTFEAERKYICWLQMYQGIHTSEEKRTIKRHKAFEEKMLMSKSIQTGKQKRIGKFWSCLPMAEHGRLMATRKLIEFLIIQFLKERSAPLSDFGGFQF